MNPRKRLGRRPLSVDIPDVVGDCLDAHLARSRRSLTAEVTVALENYLRAEGINVPRTVLRRRARPSIAG